MQNSSNEITSSKQLRSFADISLSRTLEDTSKQVNRTSEEFCKRISDATYAKTALETQQNQTQMKINDIKKNLVNLQTELEAKEKFLILCQNRLENRAFRPGTELCKDRVHGTLINEMQTLQETIHHLKHMINKVSEATYLPWAFLFFFYCEQSVVPRRLTEYLNEVVSMEQFIQIMYHFFHYSKKNSRNPFR